MDVSVAQDVAVAVAVGTKLRKVVLPRCKSNAGAGVKSTRRGDTIAAKQLKT